MDSVGGCSFKREYPLVSGRATPLQTPPAECLSATALLYKTAPVAYQRPSSANSSQMRCSSSRDAYSSTTTSPSSMSVSGDASSSSHLLVWLKMPWEDAQEVSRFACRFGAAVGVRTVVVTVSHLDGAFSPTLARARLITELTEIIHSTATEGILLGGFEVAGALCLSVQAQLAAKLVGTVVFDPCVGWSSYRGGDGDGDIRTRFLVQFAKDMDRAFDGAVLAWLPASPSQPVTPLLSRYATSLPPVLLCVDYSNVWMDCVQAFAHASVVANRDITVETYCSVHTHEFMSEVEMWARSAVAVRGFQCQDSTSSTPLSGFHKFRSLATMRPTGSNEPTRMRVCISGDNLSSWPGTPQKWSHSLDTSISEEMCTNNQMSAFLPKPILGSLPRPSCYTNGGKQPPIANVIARPSYGHHPVDNAAL